MYPRFTSYRHGLLSGHAGSVMCIRGLSQLSLPKHRLERASTMPLLSRPRTTFAGLGHSSFPSAAQLSNVDTLFISSELTVQICNKWVADRPLLVWDGVVQKCTEKNRELKQLPRRNIRQQCHGVGIYTTILGCIVVAFAADFVKFFFMDQCGYLYYIVGILQLFYDRWRRDQLFPLDGSENTWGFGQLVPILLIVIPLLSTVKLFYGKNPIKTLHESCASDVSLEIAEQRSHANSETEE
jgi:hypothetical protein